MNIDLSDLEHNVIEHKELILALGNYAFGKEKMLQLQNTGLLPLMIEGRECAYLGLVLYRLKQEEGG